MPLRFFADHCVPHSVIQSLRDAGHEMFPLGDHLPVESPDSAVIEKAQQLDAILISLNGDFADIVAYPPDEYKGIIALQIRNRPEVLSSIIERLRSYLSKHLESETHYR